MVYDDCGVSGVELDLDVWRHLQHDVTSRYFSRCMGDYGCGKCIWRGAGDRGVEGRHAGLERWCLQRVEVNILWELAFLTIAITTLESASDNPWPC